jgi:hypothetical protein
MVFPAIGIFIRYSYQDLFSKEMEKIDRRAQFRFDIYDAHLYHRIMKEMVILRVSAEAAFRNYLHLELNIPFVITVLSETKTA